MISWRIMSIKEIWHTAAYTRNKQSNTKTRATPSTPEIWVADFCTSRSAASIEKCDDHLFWMWNGNAEMGIAGDKQQHVSWLDPFSYKNILIKFSSYRNVHSKKGMFGSTSTTIYLLYYKSVHSPTPFFIFVSFIVHPMNRKLCFKKNRQKDQLTKLTGNCQEDQLTKLTGLMPAKGHLWDQQSKLKRL